MLLLFNGTGVYTDDHLDKRSIWKWENNMCLGTKKSIEKFLVFDPEQVGTLLNNQLPNNLRKRNFQDYPLWRVYNFKLLEHLSLHSNDTIIVPMTISYLR